MKRKYVILDTGERNAVFDWICSNEDYNNPIKIRVTKNKTILKGSHGAKMIFNHVISLRDAELYKMGKVFNRWKTYTIEDLCWRS
jgi:hypothetical protein